MMSCPTLPSIIEYNGDYIEYEKVIYEIFQRSFENKILFFRNQKINHKKCPEQDGKSATFYHITSTGPDEQNRIPDFRRYERIEWPFYILENCIDKCNNLLIWENKRGSKQRILIWCKTADYLIILEKRTDYLLFWTAYPVTYNHTKEKLLKEYYQYKAKIAQLT